jgi:hypothetical protein
MMRWIAITQLVVGAALVHGEAWGQAPSACVVPASDRSVPGTVRGTLRPLDDHPPSAEYTAAVLDAIGAQYPTNAPVALAVYVHTDSGAMATGSTAVEFTTTKTGAVEHVTVLATSLSPRFDQNVVDAITAAGVNGLPPIPEGSGGHVRYQLDVYATTTKPETVSDTLGAVSASWVATAIPVWSQTAAAGALPGKAYNPGYPHAALHGKGAGDSVLVQFVIGADGRVAPGTALLLHARYREFVESVSNELAAARFRPEAIGGCPVASIVSQPFAFKIAK